MVRYNLLSDRELNYVIWNERFAKTTKRQKRDSGKNRTTGTGLGPGSVVKKESENNQKT